MKTSEEGREEATEEEASTETPETGTDPASREEATARKTSSEAPE